MIKKLLMVAVLIIMLAIAAIFVNNHVTTNSEVEALTMKGTQAETEHGDIRVHDFGEGSPLVFLSGMGTTSPYHDFKPLWDILQEDFRIIILERPGYGYNHSSSRDKAVETVVESYREALDMHDIEGPYDVFAHSMGGLEAVHWSQTHPGEIDTLIGLDIAMAPWTVEMDTPGLIERNLQYLLGRSGLARFMEESDLEDALPILTFDIYDDEEREAIETLFHANFFGRDIVRESKALKDNARTILGQDVPGSMKVLLFVSEENLDANDLDETAFKDYFSQTATYESHVLDTHHYVHHEKFDVIIDAFMAHRQQND